MIAVRLDEDGRVILDAADIAELLVDAIATEHADHPHHVTTGLDEIARRRRAYEGLATVQEARDLAVHVETAAAALDAAREEFVTTLSASLDYVISESDARRLAVELSRHAARAAALRLTKGAAR